MSTTTCKKRKPYKRGARNKTTKTSTLLKDYFNKNNIIFYQRTAEQNIEVFLRIIVIDDINLCNMSFSYELNKNTDYSKELLDMNSKLVNGRLSVEKDSNQVTYATNFRLHSNSDVQDIYNQHFESCVSTLASLYKRKIIKTNE